MKTSEIMRKFLEFFRERGHMEIKNSSLVPKNDSTLLIINSGMAPLKDYFTGAATPSNSRLCNIQRCLRTNDIDSVGDPHHLTFFEMLGNWSIGDYFKKKAIDLSWELMTSVYGFDTTKMWVTVYGGDEKKQEIAPDNESIEYWAKYLPDDRIVKLSSDSNFWGPTSDTGPCGPCTEIYIDRGEETGCGKADCGLECECGRFLEIWNAGVFMEYYFHKDGSYASLPKKNVDAGAGIERFSLVLQNVGSIYETDNFSPLMDIILSASDMPRNFRSARIIADHVRASVFMIADSIYPGKTKREYVLRRIMRRVLLHLQLLELSDSYFSDISKQVINQFSDHYPHLKQNSPTIEAVIRAESKSFGKVLRRGMKELEKLTDNSSSLIIAGSDAFKLHDTLGFSIEITKEVAKSKGMTVDIDEFNSLLEEQRNRSR